MADQNVEIAIIGVGFSGIAAAVKLREAGLNDIAIFEKTNGISGTWHDNSYPGAACDVPSHLYCFSFAPNPNWSRVYSPQGEIKAYASKVVKDHGLQPLIQFNTEIVSAKFDEKQALWRLTTQDKQKITARFVLWSSSFLGTPAVPDFAGLSAFKGPIFHSARWDHSVDLNGKNVGIIGSAASALQIGPAIMNNVKSLTMFQRTANYVMPRGDREYSSFEKTMFRMFPFTNRLLRWIINLRQDKFFLRAMQPGSWVNKFIQNRSLNYLSAKIKDPGLRKKLTGTYQLGCKRILISDNFYDMFLAANVTLNTDGIDQFVADGIQSKSGELIPLDAVVLATGFTATQFMPGIRIMGKNGTSLAKWRKQLRCLKGLMAADFPNTFFLLGPNTGLGHSSMILMIESQLPYMIETILRLKPGQSVEPKPEAVERYSQQLQNKLSGLIWATSCQSWYKREDGFIPTMWPGSTGEYEKMMQTVDWSELKINPAPTK